MDSDNPDDSAVGNHGDSHPDAKNKRKARPATDGSLSSSSTPAVPALKRARYSSDIDRERTWISQQKSAVDSVVDVTAAATATQSSHANSAGGNTAAVVAPHVDPTVLTTTLNHLVNHIIKQVTANIAGPQNSSAASGAAVATKPTAKPKPLQVDTAKRLVLTGHAATMTAGSTKLLDHDGLPTGMNDSIDGLLPPAKDPHSDTASKKDAWAVLLSGSLHYRHEYICEEVFTIGRHWRCDLRLSDPAVSRLCVKLYRDNTGSVFVVCETKSGRVTVNGKTVVHGSTVKLSSGDVIFIGAATPILYLFCLMDEFKADSGHQIPDPPNAAQIAATSKLLLSSMSEKFKSAILTPDQIDISFDHFPNYLNDALRQLLEDAVILFLKRPDLLTHTDALAAVNRGILLTGAAGTERYQVKLVKALAHEMNANLLIAEEDHFVVPPAPEKQPEAHAVSLSLKLGDVATAASSPLPSKFKDRSFIDADHLANVGSPSSVDDVTSMTCQSPWENSDSLLQAINSSAQLATNADGNVEGAIEVRRALALTTDAKIEDDSTAVAQQQPSQDRRNIDSMNVDVEEDVVDAAVRDPSAAPSEPDLNGGNVLDLTNLEAAPLAGNVDDTSAQLDSTRLDAMGSDGSPFDMGSTSLGEDRARMARSSRVHSFHIGDRVCFLGPSQNPNASARVTFAPGEDEAVGGEGDAGPSIFVSSSETPAPRSLEQMFRSISKAGSSGKDVLLRNFTKQLRSKYGSARPDAADSPARAGQSASTLLSSERNRSTKLQGPPFTSKGSVLRVFANNPQYVLVRFDRSFPGASSLDQEENCLVVNASDIKLEQETPPMHDDLCIQALFETAHNSGACIIYIPDPERTILTSNERLIRFRDMMKAVSGRVVVICSNIWNNSGDIEMLMAGALNGGAGVTSAPLPSSGGFAIFGMSGLSMPFDSPMEPPTAPSVTASSGRAVDRAYIPPALSIDRKTALGSVIGPTTRSSVFRSAVGRLLSRLLPSRVIIYPPTDASAKKKWSVMLENDGHTTIFETNMRHLHRILARLLLTCDNCPTDFSATATLLHERLLSSRAWDLVLSWALAETARDNLTVPSTTGASSSHLTKSAVSWESIENAVLTYEEVLLEKRNKKISPSSIECENQYEKQLLSNVIPSDQVGVTFEDIGSLTKTKNTLFELVILPLQRPELFRRGNLMKPCKGILLFGPPGTGKTMLAKAIAAQSGANFLNIAVSSISSKWMGEGEKYAKAVFTLASKIAPCVIFIDEVDSMLGKRDSNTENDSFRKIKNEFMSMWDGMTTHATERVVILGATNRPFDLDDAVLRRMPRRVLVDLPDQEQRVQILKVILRDEIIDPNMDIARIAQMMEGYSGSDIKNVCVAAAYHPIRELLVKEKKQREHVEQEKAAEPAPSAAVETNDMANSSLPASYRIGNKRKRATDLGAVLAGEASDVEPSKAEPVLRALCEADFEKAVKEVSASCSESARSIAELRKWNDTFGEGAQNSSTALSYFM